MGNWRPDLEITHRDTARYYLRQAYACAIEESQDPYIKVGAVIVNPADMVVGTGANRFPRGLEPTSEQLADVNWRIENIIHAEHSAIFNAAKHGKSTDVTTMYMPWFPCFHCAEAIVDAGITELIGHRAMINKTRESWFESMKESLKLFRNAGVGCFVYEGEIGKVKGFFEGREWTP